jgi:hypothetical protein
MKRLPQFQNKIWKWDFAPSGESSSTRKGWRLFAYVPDPQAPEPIPARAFVCYDKDQEPKGNPAKFLADLLKKFLAETVNLKVEEDRFKRQVDSDGTTISLCLGCWDTVAMSADISEIELAESTHECSPPDEIAASGA